MDEREQSYYYQKVKKKRRKWGWETPRFIRRFTHQYPNLTMVGLALGTLTVFCLPATTVLYDWFTLSPEEFKRRGREEKTAYFRRAFHGEGMRIPFTNEKFNMATQDEIYLSELQEVRRMKKFKREFNQINEFFGMPPPIDVPEDD